MKKRMLKITALVSLAMLLTAGFAGCKKTECEWCGEMKRCKTVYLSLLGEYNMCEDCEGCTDIGELRRVGRNGTRRIKERAELGFCPFPIWIWGHCLQRNAIIFSIASLLSSRNGSKTQKAWVSFGFSG